MAYETEMKKVRAARMALMGNHPFWGDLAFGLPITFDDKLNPPTAATNGSKVVFHPKFVMDLPKEELMFVVAHEVQHCALMHVLRRGNRDPKRWNVACDIVDNYLLVQNGVGKMPSFCIYEPDLYWQGDGKVEKIYDLLPANGNYGEPGSGNGPGGKGSMDALLDADPADADNLAADWRNKLEQAAQTARKAGKMPGGMEDFLDAITTPKVPWQNVLRNFVMTTRGTDRTYARRNRRYAALDVILPGADGEKMGEIGMAIDCSGSTSDKMISQAGSEMGSIQEELRPEKAHVLYFDTNVKKHDEFEPDEPLTVKAYGRGGTCFRTMFEHIEKSGANLECLIVVTDLECSDYGPKPPYPVLWLAEDTPYARSCAEQVPWGEVLFYN